MSSTAACRATVRTHGFIVSLPEGRRGALWAYKTPSAREDALWAVSGAASDTSGDLYVATGNGANGPGQRFDYANSVVKLSPGFRVLGYYAPSAWAYMAKRTST
ncbi:MAG: hypothetical protein ACYCSF_00300 [Acidimicrobiales bacterium]